MAHCPQLQIDRAFTLMMTGVTPDEAVAGGYNDPLLKKGWDLGYTMGEDAGFDRGWAGASRHFRPWWLKLWHRLRGVKYEYVGRWMNDASYYTNLE